MQARRYAVANIRSVSRSLEDLPPLASDDELVAWARELNTQQPQPQPEAPRLSRPNRPLVATRISSTMSTEELLLDISDRARKVFRTRVTARR
jgi:hypothetical protein